MKIKKNVYRYVLMFIIMCFEIQFIYLLPTSWTIFGLDYQWICTIIETVCFLCLLLRTRGKIYNGPFHWIIWIGLILVLTSSLAGVISYGQSIFNGLVLQKTRISNFLFFFVVYAWYKENKITISGIKKTIVIFAIICGVIYITQYALSNTVTFTYSTTNEKIRYDSVRFWFNTIYLVIASAIALDDIMNSKKVKWKKIIILLLPVFVNVMITKTRTSALSIIAAMLICLLVHKGTGRKKIFGIVVVIIGLIILSFTSVGQDIFNIISQGVSEEDTLTVRNLGRDYYISKTIENPISFLFGCGYASSSNNIALNMAYPIIYSAEYGYSIMFYPQDNGIFGQFFFYGFSGIVWWLCVLIAFVKTGIKIHRNTGITLFLFFVIYEVGFSITSIPQLFGSKLIISFLIILMTDEYLKIKNNKRILNRIGE